MVALQKVVDNHGKGVVGSRDISKSSAPRFIANSEISETDDQTMDLQRRGQAKGQTKGQVAFWRCYFNAVTCFKRK
ncbi:hypothetical protein EAG_01561 [Camponotus floridanus]|uniref:Uncharacterized protein n=2 Tax=Camponotus floridanus TaxID=104421 RepID=E2AVU9_CAMFO|nr:hypothetical protein EAG_01561 [Camponotus floridanus]